MKKFSKQEIESEYLKGTSLRYSDSKNLEMREFIENSIKEDVPHKEKVFLFLNPSSTNICKNPKCPNKTKFQNFTLGYRETCSVSCSTIVNKDKQEQTRLKNIQEKVKELSIEEIVKGLYTKTLKIQKWRDIDKLKEYKDFYSIEQLYRHLILNENQICENCGKPFDIDKKTKEPRKCICTTKEERTLNEMEQKFDLDKFIDMNLHIEYKHKPELYKKAQEIYFSFYEKLPWTKSLSENIYCLQNNIIEKPSTEYVDLRVGYKKEPFYINFKDNNFFENINALKEKYSERGIFTAFETKEYCKQFLGRTVIETIFLKEHGMNKIPICKKCDKEAFFNQPKRKYSIYCKECMPTSGFSLEEKEVLEYIKTFYKGNILENDRSLGIELDIFIPEMNIAIEYDGVYWHSSFYKNKNYHLNKTEICEENGINLIHIFSTEWNQKKDIVKSILKSKLGFSQRKIYARKCFIKEISSKISNKFLEENHLQGKDNSPIRYGLYSKEGGLVQIFTLKRSHRSKEKYLELKRSCSILGTNVVGGFSKLLKYAKSIHNEDIVTFADRRYSSKENVYSRVGEFISVSPENYFYIIDDKLESREKFQKHKLKDILLEFNASLTEKENMNLNGIFEIYDCGNWKYKL